MSETIDATRSLSAIATACHYGSKRPWIVCPLFQRRAGLLFLRWGRFACRHCQKVAYSSQSDDELDGLWRKQATLEKRLGTNWQRPKGMRSRTYERLLGQLWGLEERRDRAFGVAVSNLMKIAR